MFFPQSSGLDTQHLQRLFDNMSECYKLFWFQAIIESVAEGKTVLTYDDLVNKMIANAWYMVSEYKLNLGPADTLEAVVHYARKQTNLKSSEKRETIISALSDSRDRELLKKKQVLTYNVPYRLQAPFMPELKGRQWDGSKQSLADRINENPNLIYRFLEVDGLNSKIEVAEEWAAYFKENFEIVMGWIEYNQIMYLQRRNPNVPGISSKLSPPQERKLEKVKKLWKTILTVEPVFDIYGHEQLTSSDISIDHFVPWSYVANDELWNLSPTTKSINSSKSNNLPEWNIYFHALSEMEYRAYTLSWENDAIKAEFQKCVKEHVNSAEVQYKLYRPDITQDEYRFNLEQLMRPVYEAAQNVGFDRWTYE